MVRAMSDDITGSYPLPDDPVLADAAMTTRDSGHWGLVFDSDWRLAYVTDELRVTFGGGSLASFALGAHWFGPDSQAAAKSFRFGPTSAPLYRSIFAGVGDFVLTDTQGGKDELRTLVDPLFADMIDDLSVTNDSSRAFDVIGAALKETVGVRMIAIRLRRSDGRLSGTMILAKPAVGMHTISSFTSNADLGHLERMELVSRAGRRAAAVLFADLEGSTPLSRRLSTASYFALGRRLVTAADQCIVDAGGLVGRHVGDGVVAFFLAETAGSESAAVRACIEAARALREAVDDVAVRSEIDPADVVLRFGLHWGSTLFVGNITTAGRSEVTALGDEVNEAARIEACATGGRALASKHLVERLDEDDAAALGLDPNRITYTILGELPSASEKARRDAPAIAVCAV
jgi:class 3 adenylate cyclase